MEKKKSDSQWNEFRHFLSSRKKFKSNHNQMAPDQSQTEVTKSKKKYEGSEDLHQFVKEFKEKRLKLGFMQEDVALAIGKLYGCDYSQTTISRFEAFRLSTRNMYKLKPFLQHWLECADSVNNQDCDDPMSKFKVTMPEPINRKRKRRTTISNTVWHGLEKSFQENQKPPPEELKEIAETLSLDVEVVKVWFANRRQKEKRSRFDESSPSSVFSHAITVDFSGKSQSHGTDVSMTSNNSEHLAEKQESTAGSLVAATCSNIVRLECPVVSGLPFPATSINPQNLSKGQVNTGFKTYIIVSPAYANIIKIAYTDTSKSSVAEFIAVTDGSANSTNSQNTVDPRAYCFAAL